MVLYLVFVGIGIYMVWLVAGIGIYMVLYLVCCRYLYIYMVLCLVVLGIGISMVLYQSVSQVLVYLWSVVFTTSRDCVVCFRYRYIHGPGLHTGWDLLQHGQCLGLPLSLLLHDGGPALAYL